MTAAGRRVRFLGWTRRGSNVLSKAARGPKLPTCASQKVVSYLRDSGREA
jgi:hypothetical protein